jgi:hypothetical protein
LARAADQIRASDVARWGVIALVCWAFAVLMANLSALVPPSLLAGLHGSRLEGATLNQLRTQVASLQQESERMRRENTQLVQQIALGVDSTNLIGRRVGALEVSMPKLVETQSQLETALRTRPMEDDTVTGAITEGQVLTYEAQGGTVSVQQRPLVPTDDPGAAADLPVAAPVSAGPAEGVALGFPIDPREAEPSWQELLANAGTLLNGMGPVLTSLDSNGRKQLVVGPLPDARSAADLCRRLDAIAIPCEPAPFTGDPVPLLN